VKEKDFRQSHEKKNHEEGKDSSRRSRKKDLLSSGSRLQGLLERKLYGGKLRRDKKGKKKSVPMEGH